MGALNNGYCYATTSDAADNHFSGAGPAFTAGSTSYQQWYEKVAGVWVIKRQSIASNGSITNLANSNATIPVFAPCDENQNFFDGLTLGWGVAAAMVAAFAVKFIARGLTR
jgi:hypothetical protein